MSRSYARDGRGGRGREGEGEEKLKVGSIQECERKGEVCTLSTKGGSMLSLCPLPLPQWVAHEHKHVKLLVYVFIQTRTFNSSDPLNGMTVA